MIGLARARVQRPTPPVALPCPALPIALPCWLRAALPCPSRRPAGRAPPSPAFHVALLVAKSPCHARTPPCWPPHRTALPTRRPALPAHHTAGSRAALPCMRVALPCPLAALLATTQLPASPCCIGAAGVAGAGAAGAGGAGGAGGTAGVGGTRGATGAGGTGATSPTGAGGAGAGGAGGAAGAGATTAGGNGAASSGGHAVTGGTGPAGALRHLLGLPPAPTKFPVAESLTKRRELETRASTLEHREPETRASVGARVPCVHRSRALAVPRTHDMTLRPSSVPQRVVLPSPPESSLLAVADPPYDLARASSPTVTRFLAM
ncbi:unnamed protein product, partial [Closterium sp. NIES-53]